MEQVMEDMASYYELEAEEKRKAKKERPVYKKGGKRRCM